MLYVETLLNLLKLDADKMTWREAVSGSDNMVVFWKNGQPVAWVPLNEVRHIMTEEEFARNQDVDTSTKTV